MRRILFLMITLLATACGEFKLPSQGGSALAQTNGSQALPKILSVNSNFSNQVWSSMSLIDTGAAGLELAISPHSGVAELFIHVTRYHGQGTDISFSLTPESNYPLYIVMADVLDSSATMQSFPAQTATSTGSQIQLRHPAISVIPTYLNPKVNGSRMLFDELYQYVAQKI